MPTRLVCLSNSNKLGGRCLAGIELDNQNNPVIIYGRPKWIRPICNTVDGEVPYHLVSQINILDIIEIEVTGNPNTDYQSENALFIQNSIRTVGTFEKNNLYSLCENPPTIYNNVSNAVTQSEIKNLYRSLVLINIHNFEFAEGTNNGQKRLIFTYGEDKYNLPITDPVFLNNYKSNNNFLDGIKELFLCLSLGMPFHGLYYKLVAGIITGNNNYGSKVFSDIKDAESALSQYPGGFTLKLAKTPQGWIIHSIPKDISTDNSRVVEPTVANTSSENSTLTVVEAAMKHLGVTVVVKLARFTKPGWFYVGKTISYCPNCNCNLAGFRSPYTSAGRTYHYWALVCPSCEVVYEPNQLGQDAKGSLYKSSSLRSVPEC